MSVEPTPPEQPRAGTHGVSTHVFVAFVAVLAVVLGAVGWAQSGPPTDFFALALLCGLGVVGWLLREVDVGSRIQLSFASIVLLASVVIVGPFGAAIVGATATLVQKRGMAPVVRVFNIAMFSSMGSIGALVYLASGGLKNLDDLGAAQLLISVGLPMMVAEVAQCLTNAVLLSGVMYTSARVPFRTNIWNLLTTTGAAYVGYGIIGFLYVVLWIPAGIGWFSSALVLAPLFIARWAFVQYGEEQRAHERTLNALVTAQEIKDPGSAGHGGRVGQLCGWIAEAMVLGYKEAQEVRTAGMLHDLGRIAVPSRLLRSHRELTDAELVLMAEHPMTGARMLAGIDFLRESVAGVTHHHERYDGLGFPHGLSGEQIPVFARIIAVADAFDALTTERPYRPALNPGAALETVAARADTQFDSVVVAALRRAIDRHGWSVTERSLDFFATAGSAVDHDDPEASELLARRPDLREQIRATAVSRADEMMGSLG